MKFDSFRPASFAACFAVWILSFPTPQAKAGSLVIPAWSFARGNMVVDANPDKFADAQPVVIPGMQKPWGWAVEYDIDIPVTGEYKLQICYAAGDVRPVEVYFDGKAVGKCCTNVTIDSSNQVTWNSSGAKWEVFQHTLQRGRGFPATKGKYTLKLTRRGPLPHFVAVRLDTTEEFPKDWRPPQYKVRNIESIPEKHRATFQPTDGINTSLLRLAIEDTIKTFGPRYTDGKKYLQQLSDLEKQKGVDEELMKLRNEALALWADTTKPEKAAGSLVIPACSFDRGNAQIFASPDEHADYGPIVGGGTPEQGTVEYDIDIPVTGDYTFQVQYAAGKARPVMVFLDGKNLGICCTGITFGSSPFETPVRGAWNSREAKWQELRQWATPQKLSLTEGKHTLKLTRGGPLPHIMALRLDTLTAFPESWTQPKRKVDISKVPPRYRNVFLPANSVNVATLRMAIEDTNQTFGPRYPNGQQALKQLSELEEKQKVATGNPKEEQAKADSLVALRKRAMLSHPALDFDALVFLKRPSNQYGHTYADQKANTMGGNLCVLSPVSPDGKITNLVPELEGGLFDRFDLSFDAKKLVFGYKLGPKEAFRLYEIDLDPAAGKMVPGSLRQLTFGGDDEDEAIRIDVVSGRTFHDMDPCYLPNGKIMFTSTRAMQNVFCSGSSAVSTLYVMDADGKNMRQLSRSPVNETAPSMLDDGRVLYTRWEYLDKGLGNGAGLWAVRPDGSGAEHLYKNNTVWPAGMASARLIPGSHRIVTIGGGHHYNAVGTVVIVDPIRSKHELESMDCITPAIGYPHSMGYPRDTFGIFMDPFPFSEKFFLVSHRPAPKDPKSREKPKYGLYALDSWGNRAELYSDPDFNCFEPMPLRPRPKPVKLGPIKTSIAKSNGSPQKTGSLFIQDMYQGMTGIERGRVKYVRVMGALSWPWGQRNGKVALNADVHRKKVFGIAKVHEDGSTFFNVPANENIFFQALDENYMSLQHMATFINLMPGENRSCIGCHEHRGKAPSWSNANPVALNYPVQTLVPQPGDTKARMVHYPADVQPIFNKRCVSCHSGENPKGQLDLSDELTQAYSRSYENLIGKGLVDYRDGRYGKSGFRAVPPLTHGSHRSKLVSRILSDPCKSDLTREEFIKIVTWIDANVPYYGTLRGKRGLEDKDHPDFRPAPLAGKP